MKPRLKPRLLLAPVHAAAFLTLAACVTVNVYFPAAAVKDLSRKIEEEVQKEAAKTENQKGPGAEAAPAPGAPAPAPERPAEKPPRNTGAGSAGAGSIPAGTSSAAIYGLSNHSSPASGASASAGSNPVAAVSPVSASLFDTLLGVTPAFAQAGDVAAPEVSSPAIRKIIESRAARVAALARYKAQGVIGENNKGLVEVRSLDSLTDLKNRAEVQRLVNAENTDREELYREIAAAKKVDPSQLPKIRETYASTLREFARPGEWIQMPDGAWKQK